MSLATRCPSCDTVFRVVQDQLRVSEGWVRCGRCDGVFNAAEVLFDIDSGATVGADLGPPGPAAGATEPPSTPAAPSATASAPASASTGRQPPVSPPPPPPPSPAPAPQPPPAPAWSLRTTGATAGPAWPGGRQEPQFDANTDIDADAEPRRQRSDHAEEPLLRAPSRHQVETTDGLVDEIVITDHVPTVPRARLATSLADSSSASWSPALPALRQAALADQASVRADFSVAAAAAASAAATPSPVQALPSFLRTAERDALWRRPAMRAAAAIGVVLLAIVLVLQAAVLWRDTLAARWPASAPALTALCQLAGCSVQPLRRIEALAVHSSGLNRLECSTLYRLQVVLQNRADTALMMPALDLTLNDAQGKPIARRVLQAAELGAPQTVLQAGEELPIKALLSTGERRVDGYTLELFYP